MYDSVPRTCGTLFSVHCNHFCHPIQFCSRFEEIQIQIHVRVWETSPKINWFKSTSRDRTCNLQYTRTQYYPLGHRNSLISMWKHSGFIRTKKLIKSLKITPFFIKMQFLLRPCKSFPIWTNDVNPSPSFTIFSKSDSIQWIVSSENINAGILIHILKQFGFMPYVNCTSFPTFTFDDKYTVVSKVSLFESDLKCFAISFDIYLHDTRAVNLNQFTFNNNSSREVTFFRLESLIAWTMCSTTLRLWENSSSHQ